MQLQMRSQMAKIGMEIDQPFLALRNIAPRIELQIEKPELQIHSPRPVLHIDQTQCFADMDKRTPSEFAAYYAALGWSDSMQGIARIASEGDWLAQIHTENSVAGLAAKNLGKTADFNVTAIPKQPPRTWVDTSPVQYEFRPGSVEVEVQPGRVENHFQWGKVNIYLRQQNYLQIDWVDNRLDRIA